MKLVEIVAWYQKKIGTYDKQQWEKTVEQKILDGFSSRTLKTAKLKTELIDVDLVRGSTFPKAKPKQSLLTVVRLAIQRYFLLPIYAQWWVKQTSHNAFAMLFILYMLQMLSWAVYTYNTNRGLENFESLNVAAQEVNGTINDANSTEEHIVFISDLLIPMALSFLLSLIHSQIVATNIATGVKVKRRRFSNTNTASGGVLGNNKPGREPRPRRRKKLVKVRSQDISDSNSTTLQQQQQQQQRKSTASQTLKKQTYAGTEQIDVLATNQQLPNINQFTSLLSKTNNTNCQSQTASQFPPNRLITLDLKNTLSSTDVDALCASISTSTDCLTNKKRNVNWHLPIRNYAIETQEKQQQTSPQTTSATTTSSSETNTPNANGHKTAQNSSSSNSANNSLLTTPIETVRIDECVQEFYDELVNRADEFVSPPPTLQTKPPLTAKLDPAEQLEPAADSAGAQRRAVGEDDGFESLNGKSSSGEETNASLLPTTSSALRLRLNATRVNEMPTASTIYRRQVPLSSESDADKNARRTGSCEAIQQQPKNLRSVEDDTTDNTDEDGDDVENVSSPASAGGNNSNYAECTTSATEWLGVTTNSEECSYSSELENSDDYSKTQQCSDEEGLEMDFVPATILNPHGSSDRISCTIWDKREIKKAPMSVLEISSCIIECVESMPETNDYIFLSIVFSLILSFVPTFCRLCEVTIDSDKNELSYWDLPQLLWEKSSFSFLTLFHFAFGQTQWERTVLVMSLIQRFCLTMTLFIIFAVAERTFKQRFLYAKLFSHLTSSRRARKSNLPHFRLNKVRNIKTWLSVRSYLKKRGPQRSVDVIVSAAFIITHLLLAFLSVEWLKDSVHLHSHLNLEALMWSSTVGIFLLRFMTLGNKIHHKYRSISVLITEQINLYLQIEQKPKKKDELMVSNSVLKLAADLLKELESPFKVSGLRANPYLFTTIKVVILSALSGVLSEMLGFKLKLLKIKIK